MAQRRSGQDGAFVDASSDDDSSDKGPRNKRWVPLQAARHASRAALICGGVFVLGVVLPLLILVVASSIDGPEVSTLSGGGTRHVVPPSLRPAPSRGPPAGWELSSAARRGDAREVAELLARGADPSARSRTGVTPLLDAAEAGHVDAVRALIKAGANVNAADVGGGTPLIAAASAGHLDVVRALLAAGADVRPSKVNDGGSALSRSARHDHLEIVKALIAAGADVNWYDSNGKTPLFYAAEDGRRPMLDLLLGANADVNREKRSDGVTPLHIAAERGDSAMAVDFIARGANVNATSKWDGRSSLMRAAEAGHVDVVRALLNANAEIDRSHNDGMTALSYAARGGRIEVVRELLARGADVSIKSGWRHDGPTAEQLATERGHTAIADLIRASANASDGGTAA